MGISRKKAVAVCAFVGLAVIFSAAVWLLWSGPAARADVEPPILVLEKELQLKSYPQTYIWAPDNRHMLLASGRDGKLRIIDTESNDAEGRVITNDIGTMPSLAWSSDGNLIAVSTPKYEQNTKIRIWSAKNGALTTSLSNENLGYYQGCPFDDSSLAFSLDSKALWLSCNRFYKNNNTQNDIVAAVKIEIDGLALKKSIRVDNSLPGQPLFISAQTFSTQNGVLNLCFVLNVSRNSPRSSPLLEPIQSIFCFNTEKSEKLFPPIPFLGADGSGYFRNPEQIMPLLNKVLLRLSQNVGTKGGVPGIPERDRQFDLYDTTSSKRIAAYGGRSPHDERLENESVTSMALLPGGNLAVSGWNKDNFKRSTREPDFLTWVWAFFFGPDPRIGGLFVFDINSGKVRQRLPGKAVDSLALTIDGRKLAAIDSEGKLRIFRVIQ